MVEAHSGGLGKVDPNTRSPPPPPMGGELSTGWARLLGMTLGMIVWTGGSLWWLDLDRLLRDGDEEGHVGAAELFRLALREGRWLDVLHDVWRGDLGEYPPLFPAIVGAWWWIVGEGQPGAVAVRAVCLGSLILTAVCTAAAAARLLGREGGLARALALFATLTLPLSNGVTRHFMPEGLVMGLTALSVLAGLRAVARPSTVALGLWGLSLGLGLLTKQTFALYALGPALWVGVRLGRRAMPGLLIVGLVAGPWYLDHLEPQLRYGEAAAQSGQGGPGAGLWAQLRYYPVVLGLEGLGPALTLGALLALVLGWRDRAARPALRLGALWVGVPLLLLLLIPKKYPRLVVPLVPGAALVLAAGLHRRPALGGALIAGAAIWTIRASVTELPTPAVYGEIDPRCPQRWLRPAVDDDLGLSRVAAAVRAAPPGPVVVLAGPEIPCALQTTPPWIDHLAPYLRREGLERDVLDSPRGDAALIIDWGCPAGAGRVEVEPLAGGFCLRAH